MKVFAHWPIEKEGFLSDVANGGPERRLGNGVQFGAIDGDGSTVVFVKSAEQIDNGRFSPKAIIFLDFLGHLTHNRCNLVFNQISLLRSDVVTTLGITIMFKIERIYYEKTHDRIGCFVKGHQPPV